MKSKTIILSILLLFCIGLKAHANYNAAVIPIEIETKETTKILYDLSKTNNYTLLTEFETQYGEYNKLACIYKAHTIWEIIPMYVSDKRYCLIKSRSDKHYYYLTDKDAQMLADKFNFKLPPKEIWKWDQFGFIPFLILLILFFIWRFRDQFFPNGFPWEKNDNGDEEEENTAN